MELPFDPELLNTWTAKIAIIQFTGILAAIILYFLFGPDPEKAVDYTLPTPAQCQPGWRGKTLPLPSIKISGATAIQCYAPATGDLLGQVNPATPNGIDRAVEKAANSQLRWARTSFAQRRRVLKTILKFVLSNQESIARAACLDSGKTRVDALFGEILVTAEKLKWTIDHGEKALKAEKRPTNFLMFYKTNEVRYEPLGVIAACVSWNYPFHNLIGPIISALFSGNAIIVKNSEQTAWSSVYFADIVRSALSECGHDPNLVQALSIWPQDAAHFTSHPGISHITFIGSRPVAKLVARDAAKALTPVCVELGGKDASIILDHPSSKLAEPSEMKRITSTLMRGVFQSAGQNCIGIERIIAMPQAYERLINLMKEKIQRLRVGNDLDEDRSEGQIDMGAMVSAASFDRLEKLIRDAVSQGAKLIAGGKRYEHPKYPRGHYFSPTMLIDVTPDMQIAQEELFAPICVMMRAASVNEAIQIANSTEYGLGASVFGPTSAAAQLQYVASAVQSGMVAINDFAAFYAVQLPFGGMKGSGYGRFAGEEGLRSLCNVKSVCADRWPSLIKTSIPGKLAYPLSTEAWKMGQGVVEVGYGESWGRKVGGIRKMI